MKRRVLRDVDVNSLHAKSYGPSVDVWRVPYGDAIIAKQQRSEIELTYRLDFGNIMPGEIYRFVLNVQKTRWSLRALVLSYQAAPVGRRLILSTQGKAEQLKRVV